MNIVTTNTQPLTMSSIEIAEVTGKQHRNVLSDIRKMLDELDLCAAEFSAPQNYGNNNTREVFNLDKNLVMTLMAKYEFRIGYAMAKHIEKLESKLKGHGDLFKYLSPQARVAIENLNEQLGESKMEVARLQGECNAIADHFVDGLTPSEFCRQLNGVNTKQVNASLFLAGYLLNTRRGIKATPYTRDRYFKEYPIEYRNNKTGLMESKSGVVMTLKGCKWLYKLYRQGKLTMKQDWDGKHSHTLS